MPQRKFEFGMLCGTLVFVLILILSTPVVCAQLPESEHPYANNSEHTWTISKPGASQIRIHFSKLELAGGDELYILDKNGKRLMFWEGKSALYMGVTDYGEFWTEWYAGDTIKIKLKTNERGTAYGFKVDDVEVRTAEAPSSQLPESYHPYANCYEHTWTISKPGASQIRIHFSKLELASGDYLYILDKNGRELKRFYGGTKKEDYWTEWYMRNTIKLKLITDSKYTAYGFKVDRVEVNTTPLPTNEYWDPSGANCEPGTVYANCPSEDYCVACDGSCKKSGSIMGSWLCYKGKWDKCDSNSIGVKRGEWVCSATGKWVKTSEYVPPTPTPKPTHTPKSTPSTSSIYISSSPSGAGIYIDGLYKGRTPKTIEVSAGTHKITLKLSGYEDWSRTVYVTAGKKLEVRARLEPLPKPTSTPSTGSIYISSSPSGAKIYIDDVYKGKTPETVKLAAGTHKVTLKLSGYKDWSQDVYVAAGKTSRVSAHLEPIVKDDAEHAISEARNCVNWMKSEGFNLSTIEPLLTKAEELFSSGKYDEAKKMAEQVRELYDAAHRTNERIESAKSEISRMKLKYRVDVLESMLNESKKALHMGDYHRSDELTSKLEAKISEALIAESAISSANSTIEAERAKGFRSKDAENLLNSAVKAFNEGEYTDAKRLAEKAEAIAKDMDGDGAPNSEDFAPTIHNNYIYGGSAASSITAAASGYSVVKNMIRRKRELIIAKEEALKIIDEIWKELDSKKQK